MANPSRNTNIELANKIRTHNRYTPTCTTYTYIICITKALITDSPTQQIEKKMFRFENNDGQQRAKANNFSQIETCGIQAKKRGRKFAALFLIKKRKTARFVKSQKYNLIGAQRTVSIETE